MLHHLIYSHTILTDRNMGVLIICGNRFTQTVHLASWYPPEEWQPIDVSYVDLDELFCFNDPVAAKEWVENGG